MEFKLTRMASSSMDFASMMGLLQAWDTDGDGLVSADDFKQGLMSLGFLITQVAQLTSSGVQGCTRALKRACTSHLLIGTSRTFHRRRPTACAARSTMMARSSALLMALHESTA